MMNCQRSQGELGPVDRRQFLAVTSAAAFEAGSRALLPDLAKASQAGTSADYTIRIGPVAVELAPGRGIKKDTVMVKHDTQVEVDFVADNPGVSLLHCHQQLHMDFGFMALVKYA
jgi:FtsP/CotA-like multicopper oxidase with cupredoxin domain